ncbi:hypothetical protein [Chryseobacterium indoltheticum]|uniref:hypothetical protein n=1 Tax=Chryseobacterium indoltheticum TaxID=254 RepID=UPI0019115F06|nr:hypothetical protein [Chryseobacterium indoltheticum]QQQ29944.1 hypothetical protein JJL46_08055 [Chryseobacterium indoltheticum]
MKENLFLRLCLIITVALSLYSCTNEDLYSSAENEKQEVASKSPWKEDQGYIKKVQKVFLQNVNTQYFERKYGTVHWDYAMSFGQFDESYLVVPILKGNTVVTVMKVYRIDDRIYFREKNDPEFISFFTDIMFKEISGIDEKVVYNNTSASAKTLEYKCTYRTFTVGCPAGYADCEPLSSTVSECKWRETGGGSPQMEICNPLECENGGGGADLGFLYPEPPEEDPCQKTKAISKDPAVKAKVGTLKEQSKIKGDNSGEKGFNVNLDGTTGEIIPGEKHSVDLGSEAGKQGGYHNHTPDGIKMHSPPDILKMLNYALAQPNGNLSNGFLGFVGSEKCSTCPDGYKYHNYIIRFSGNSQELEKFIFQTNWDEKALGNDYQKRENNLLSNNAYTDNDGESLNQKGLEKLFFDTLKGMNMEGKVNLQRVDNDGTIQNIILDNNNQPTATPCP